MFREVDEEEAAVVRRMVDEALAGRSLRAIAEGLNADGIPTPRARDAAQAGRDAEPLPWSYTAVRRVLSNPAIAGMERALGDVVRDEDALARVVGDAAIVDVETFRRVRDVVEERGAGMIRRTPHADRPLLDGLAFCSACGGPLRRVSTKGYVSYGCANASKGKCAERTTISSRVVDPFVVDTFLDTLGDVPRTRLEATEDGRVSSRLAEVRAEVTDTAAAFATAPPAEIPALAERMTMLRAAEARLLAEAEAAPVYTVVPTGRTWAETWAEAADDVTARRALLAEALDRVVVRKPARRGGHEPVADRVMVLWGGEHAAAG
jgi:site-specific DNA recombinase